MSNESHETERIRVSVKDAIATVVVLDNSLLDTEIVRELGRQLHGLVDDSGYRYIIIDFSRVTYVASSAMNKLIVLQRKVNAADGKMVLCGMAPVVREVFSTTRLNQKFEIRADREAARNSILEDSNPSS